MATLMLSIIGAVAAFERSMILERQREGIAIAKLKGNVYVGRKPVLTKAQVQEVKVRAKAGESKSALATAFKVSRATIYNALSA